MDTKEDDLEKLLKNYEENINKLFLIEKEVLEYKKKEMTTTEKVKNLIEELELYKFENDHLICIMENKNNEIKEIKKILEENEKLLHKYKAKYVTSIEKFDKILADFHMHLEKFPDPSSFNSLRGELEMLREENLNLIQRNAYLEEQLKQSKNPIEEEKLCPFTFIDNILNKIENHSLGKMQELLKTYQGLEDHIIIIENETIDWKQKCDELETKYNYVVKENDTLQKKIEKLNNQEQRTIKKSSKFKYPKEQFSEESIEITYESNLKRKDTSIKNKNARKNIRVEHNVPKPAMQKIHNDTPINITLCAMCAFNIKKKEKFIRCIECKGKMKRY